MDFDVQEELHDGHRFEAGFEGDAIRRQWLGRSEDFILNLEGKIKNGKSGYFTTDYTDFDGFHGEDHCFLTNYPLTQRISDSIFITL